MGLAMTPIPLTIVPAMTPPGAPDASLPSAAPDTGASRDDGTRGPAARPLTDEATLIERLRSRDEDAFVILVLFQHVLSSLLLAPFGLSVWKTPDMIHLAGFALAAGLGVIGHLLMANAYSRAPAARLAPLEYSALIYAAAIDFVWFGNSLTLDTVIGAAAIILSAVLATKR